MSDIQDSTESSDPDEQCHDIFVLAASAGGINTLIEIVANLPANFPGTLFITQHTSPLNRKCYMADILGRKSELPCFAGADHRKFRQSEIYIAPPDHHMLVRDGYIQTTRGPKENHSRPAADPMFRSAAAAYGSRVVGIVLSGYLDDGSSGLVAVKECGGKAIVQNPKTAIVPDMPQNAMVYCKPDYILDLEHISIRMCELAAIPVGESVTPSSAILTEIAFAEGYFSSIPAEERLGKLSPFMCPDCNGQLWESKVDEVPRFRCHVGHAHSLRSLVEGQNDSIERHAWSTLRSLNEQVVTFTAMADHERAIGRMETAIDYQQRALVARKRAAALRESFELTEQENTQEQAQDTERAGPHGR